MSNQAVPAATRPVTNRNPVVDGSASSPLTITFGDWLRHYRQSAGLTREDLAQRLSVATITIRQYERHQRRPSRDMLTHILQVLEVAPAERTVLMQATRGGNPPAPGMDQANAHLARLPLPATGLLGREKAVAAILALVGRVDRRLITLTGTGGVGKTQLALHIAHATFGGFQDGSAVVSLANVSSAELVVTEIARVVSTDSAVQVATAEALARSLSTKHMMLVLDNFEHLLPAADVVATLLRCCADLTILITSRRRLNLSSEHVVDVAPLELPSIQAMPLAELAAIPAVALFVSRAQSMYPGFALTEANAAAVSAICRRLDGLPLALELAASRLGLLTPQAILVRLGQRQSLLRGGPNDRSARHESLDAAIAWSFGLIPPPAQRLFAALSVFNGTFGLAEIPAVLPDSDEADLLEALGELVASNLVQPTAEVNGDWRFRLLETLRAFAGARLEQDEAGPAILRRYWHFYKDLALAATDHLHGSEQQRWIAELNAAYSHLQTALSGLLASDEIESALAMSRSLGRYWYIRGLFGEGQAWLARVLDQSNGRYPDQEAQVRGNLAVMLALQYDAAAISLYKENLAYFMAAGDSFRIFKTMGNMALFHAGCGHYAEAIRLFGEAQAYCEQIGSEWEIANLWGNRALMYSHLGGNPVQAEADYLRAIEGFRRCRDEIRVAINLNNYGYHLHHTKSAAARPVLLESLRMSRNLDDLPTAAVVCNNLAEVALAEGQVAEARAWVRSSLRHLATSTLTIPLFFALERSAAVLMAQGDDAFAIQILSMIQTLHPASWVMPPPEQTFHATLMAELRTKTDPALWGAWWTTGRIVAPERIIRETLHRLDAGAEGDGLGR